MAAERDRPIGPHVPNWSPRPWPNASVIIGRHCRLERLETRHAAGLFEAFAAAPDGRDWDFMPVGPFTDFQDYARWVEDAAARADPRHYAVIVDERPLGTLALMRIDAANGVIEVGYIAFARALQRTTAATEAVHLAMAWAFENGYRRFEWKCNAANAASRRAALRFGLSFEGVFRQHMVVKGRNRDTAWYAAIDAEWPALRAAFDAWLDPDNFDSANNQKRSLAEWTAPLLSARG